MASGGERPIWARWRVREDGWVEVIATYPAGNGYAQREFAYESLDAAAVDLGPNFREVVSRVLEAGRSGGRWQP